MSITDEIAAAVAQTGLYDGIDPSVGYRLGWDYWIPGKPPTDGCGIARTPHHLPIDLTSLPEGAVAIIDGTMKAVDLIGSVWRQILIRPDAAYAESGCNPFAVSDAFEDCPRARHLIALVGHSPRDLGLYLDDLRQRDGELFECVLSKNFKGAIAKCPAIADDDWPASVQARWTKPADYLPPFRVAVLYAELARLALNQAGLLAMATDGATSLNTKGLLSRIPLAGGPHQPHAVRRAIEMLPYQSIALSAPGSILRGGDAEAAAAWAKVCAGNLSQAAEQLGGLAIAPRTPKEAIAIQEDYRASPAFWVEKRDHGGGLGNRPGATRWGLSWRRQAAVGLMEIMMTAIDWNCRFRPDGPKLSRMSRERVSLALATINYAWTGETNPAAALALLRQACRNKSVAIPTAFDPFGAADFLGDASGNDLRKLGLELLADRPKPGELGYTARYQAHLWLDDHGDDIAHYQAFQRDAALEYERAKMGALPDILRDTSRVPAEVVAALGRSYGIYPRHDGIGRDQPPSLTMTDDIAEARAAQNIAMMISPLSTDPMHEQLSRKPAEKR